MHLADAIAVVGFSGLFPGAPDAATLWTNICAGFDATREVRRERWIAPPAAVFSPELQPDRAYSMRCCLLPEWRLDPDGLDLPAGVLSALDPLHLLALETARAALSGGAAPFVNREKTGVALAALVLPTDASSALTRRLLGKLVEEEVCLGKRSAAAGFEPGDRLAGRVAALPAAIVARALKLGGGSFTLDAACASSLFAVKLACDELRAGRAHAMLAGGVSRPDCLFTQVGFSQLKALSPSGRCAPFDREADGLVVGEGAGILVLKRLTDALREGDTVWGIIRGVGVSNDLRGNLLAPDSEGQLRAMRAAYAEAGWRPADIDFIECHGAGTPVGDAVELASLQALWEESGRPSGPCALGSIKSMIGHLLTAAGAAGLIKTLLAMHHGILPPTIHFRQAADGSPLIGGPFRIPTEAEPWERRRSGVPRRAAVSAFGFGGINAHLLLEAFDPEGGERKTEGPHPPLLPELGPSTSARPVSASPVAVVGMAACVGRAASLASLAQALLAGASLAGPRPESRWKGCDDALPHLRGLEGCFLEAVALTPGEFHIPPKELPDILPQHLLMLKTAAAALADAGMPLRSERLRMGAMIGIGFDFEATNFHLRWYLDGAFPRWRRTHLAHLPEHEAASLLSALKEACSPPLTASRTLGALGSMVASRIAREFRMGGASFVLSAEEASGLRALEVGLRALRSGELDAALIGAVDLCGDLRAVALENLLQPFGRSVAPGEGAVALVLKRLDRAEADGDRVYALIRGIGAASGGGLDGGGPDAGAYLRSLELAALDSGGIATPDVLRATDSAGIEAWQRIEDRVLDEWSRKRGIRWRPERTGPATLRAGALTGLLSVAAAALRLHHDPERRSRADPGTPGAAPDAAPAALAAAATADGNCMHVVLAAGPGAHAARRSSRDPQLRPAENRPAPAGLVRLPVGGRQLVLPPVPRKPSSARPSDAAAPPAELMQRLAAVSEATARAHTAFLDASSAMTRRCAEALAVSRRLAELAAAAPSPSPAVVFDREQCLEFARGSAARVMGPEFAEVDTFEARVRLPDEPLMLVDRIVEIQGIKGSLGPGRIVTEHDVLPGAWYLDGGRAPVCIAVEAGQADLFLCAWLGIDLAVRGRRTYRLLDATVEFHRELPRPGETIRYAIEIEKFLRQADTYLFLFHFQGTIDGAPLITMTAGCAGFFTREEALHSGGILGTEEEKKPLLGRKHGNWNPPVAMAEARYDDRAVEALRRGDLGAAFGAPFEGIALGESLRLPGGRMRLIDRILELDPEGGRYGLGRIRAEADIHPDDWFLTCHFVDDRVMPGTLMYECCAHTLRVMVQRLGWVSELPEARYEPLQGRKATLRCRGPVTPETRHVRYEVDVREIGYGPQPFVVADADMYADGRRIVRFSDMSLQLTGVTRQDIERFWGGRIRGGRTTAGRAAPRPVFDRRHLEEFAHGSPSLAFGEAYAPFDSGRFIARLPSPPYLFMDRITRVEPKPWVVAPGGWVEAECDLVPDAWYVAAERCGSVPYCVLLEAALQPCGWLAAYMGSALKSGKPLHFRNLGGHGTLHRSVPPDAGTLKVRTRMTHASEVPDMIIEHFAFEVHGSGGVVYDGTTYFGFFTRSALDRQEGLRSGREKAFRPRDGEPDAEEGLLLPDEPPLAPDDPGRSPAAGLSLPAAALRMIDRIELYQPRGGPRGLGFVRGTKQVDPGEWFFRAHFHQDPVCPGSLGLESFLQLLKFAALRRWPQLAATHRFAPAVGTGHRWTYRGQILPANREVAVEALVTRVSEDPHPALFGEGYLMVDGLTIYRMEEFGIRLVPSATA